MYIPITWFWLIISQHATADPFIDLHCPQSRLSRAMLNGISMVNTAIEKQHEMGRPYDI